MAGQTITGRIGLIGDPVEHSLSPSFQQVALDALNIPVRYELWKTEATQVAYRIDQLRSGEIYAANVTIPHKEAFFESVDTMSDIARRAGAVNTLMIKNGQLHGENTDVYGFIRALGYIEYPVVEATALVLGAGGAARGAVLGLLDAGASQITVANRTLNRAEQLADDLESDRLATCKLEDAGNVAAGIDLIVNATALGWKDDLPVDPGVFDQLSNNALAYDLTYRQTPFLAAAEAAGKRTLDGLMMLVYQGARSFEIWTGHDAPFDLMLGAAIRARNRHA